MTLRDLIKKKDRISLTSGINDEATVRSLHPPPALHSSGANQPIILIRSDTYTHELISPPTFTTTSSTPPRTASPPVPTYLSSSQTSPKSKHSRHSSSSTHQTLASRFRSASNASSIASTKSEKRLSGLLHLQRSSRSRSSSTASIHIPSDLSTTPPLNTVPISTTLTDPTSKQAALDTEAAWEERATLLARSNPEVSLPASTTSAPTLKSTSSSSTTATPGPLTDPKIETTLLHAIHLHETGSLYESTALFGQLASPTGPANPLAQVLYGLALRHGWGIECNPPLAVHYLSQAASSAATIESLALGAGLKAGGAAKGELTLAVFELANCYRHGWGVRKDPIGARAYYEVAANMGDVDACREAAGCWLDGVGGPKDRKRAAGYLRRAQGLEKREGKIGGGVGESWIWKEKYDP